MFCCNCGKEIDDNAKFCLACGARVDDQIQEVDPQDIPVTPVSVGSGAPKPPKKKGGKIAIVAAIALVLVGAVAAVLALGLFGSPAGQVTKAVAKSAAAFEEAYDKMGLADPDFLEDQKNSQEFEVKIGEVGGSTQFAGLGLRMNADVDLPGRVMDTELTPFYGSADLLSIQLKVDDADAYLGAPQLTGDTFYMVNTETILRDLQNMGADLGEAAQISINIFDYMEAAEKRGEVNEELREELFKACADLAANLEIEKAGSQEITVHGSDLKCKAYDVLIPADAMHTFVDALKPIYRQMSSNDDVYELLGSMGVPQEAFGDLDEMRQEMEDSVNEMFDALHEAVDQLGDVTVKLYISDGYVVSAVYENTIEGTDLYVALNIGGGENYVDNVTIEVIADGEGLRLTSTGNHGLTDGTFTDETVLAYLDDGQESPYVTMVTSYAPKQSSDNFRFTMEAEGTELALKGQLTSSKDAFVMDLDQLKVSGYGETMLDMELRWAISGYEGSSISPSNVKALSGMTEDDLMAEAELIANNGTAWISGLDAGFLNLIMSFMY